MNIYKRLTNKIVHILRPYVLYIKRKAKKIWRGMFGVRRNRSYTFAIVCVKREPYANLVLNNVNSLHYLNPTHNIIVYCDNICEKELQRLYIKFDYPNQIEFYNKFKDSNQPWQYSKINTIIDASLKEYILIDADGIWHNDPQIDSTKITFQVSPNTIEEKEDESLVIKHLFNRPNWLKFKYYTSAFLYIPKHFLTQAVIDDTYKYLEILFNNKYDFLDSQDKRDDQKRQSEQFAINLALLTNCPKDAFAVLKQTDGAKDKNIVQPLYYGCSNHILE